MSQQSKLVTLMKSLHCLSDADPPPKSPPGRGNSPPPPAQRGRRSRYFLQHGSNDYGFASLPDEDPPPKSPLRRGNSPPPRAQLGRRSLYVLQHGRNGIVSLLDEDPPPQSPARRGNSPPAPAQLERFSTYGLQYGRNSPRLASPPRQPYQPKEAPVRPQEPHEALCYPAGFRPYQSDLKTTQGARRSRPDPRHDELDLSANTTIYQDSGMGTIRLLLLGKTGSGKSTTGNTILGMKLFQTEADFSSVTADCVLKRSQREDTKVEVMDSPGLFDTTKSNEDVGTIITQCVAGMHPGPSAVLYVIRLGRYTAEEYSAYNRLKALFDPSITTYMIVLFTGGDDLENSGQSIDSLVQRQSGNIKTVLTECSQRYILFNNRATDPNPQVERLLDIVRQLCRQNGGPYVCPKYMEIGERLEAEVARRMEEVDKKELERQKYVQQLQKQTEDTEKALSKTKEDMQRKEQEQKRLVDELAKKQEQQVQALKQQIDEQQMSNERRLQEERALRERQQEEQMKMVARMEQQQREYQKVIKDLNKERQMSEAECMKLERDIDQKELQQLQKQIKHKTYEQENARDKLREQYEEMQTMKRMMDEQKMSSERRLQDELAPRDRQRADQERAIKRMEEQLKANQKKFREMEIECQMLQAKLTKEERDRRLRYYETQMQMIKDEVVRSSKSARKCSIQ